LSWDFRRATNPQELDIGHLMLRIKGGELVKVKKSYKVVKVTGRRTDSKDIK
jgi:hypothetical protein